MRQKPSTSRGTRLGLAILAIAAVTACSHFTIRTDRAPDVDFARYRTFAWLPLSAAPPDDQTTGDRGLDKRVYEAIEGDLERKGYVLAAPDTADLLVTYRLLKTDGYDEAHLPYQAQWYRGAYLTAAHASADSYTRGTLIIDVVDRRADELVWRGSASARLYINTAYDKAVARAQLAIEQTLATFPAR